MKLGRIPNIGEVYSNFKSYQRSKIQTPISKIVSDIYRFSNYFVNMAFLNEKDPEIKRLLSDINTLKVDVAYPFLLEVYDDYANHLLSREDFIAILKLIESYVFRRVICGVPTNSMNKTFATLAKEIDKESYLDSVQVALLLKDSYRRFPNDEEFRAAFTIKDVYNFRSRNYLLRKLENYREKELVNVESCTIEHIMPQNDQLSTEWQEELGTNWQEIHAKYLHTIGNLTLTGYNSELSDRSFREKRDMEGGFAHSPLRLNRDLASLERWNEEEIKKRAHNLADIAVKIWSIPQLSPEQLDTYSKQVQRLQMTEVIGPFEHPLAGHIPEDLMIIQRSEKRFDVYRKIGNEWLHCGRKGYRQWAGTWEIAGIWAREIYNENIVPSKIQGVQTLEGFEVDAIDGYGSNYRLEDYAGLQGDMRELFEQLRKRILNLDSSVREEYKKQYIAYKTTTNFVDIEPQMRKLLITLNMKFDEINDPVGLCRDVTHIGHFGNGDIEIAVSSPDQINDVMDLVRQSFERHLEEVYA